MTIHSAERGGVRQPLETAITLLIGAAALVLAAYHVGNQDVTPSIDIFTLHLKHLHECALEGVDPLYHLPTEPLLTVFNKLAPGCISGYATFSLTLTAVLLLLHMVMFLQIRSNVARLFFVVLSVLLADLYTQTHLFRQTAASYLIGIWLLRQGRMPSSLPLAAFLLHNGTTLLLIAYFCWRQVLRFARQHSLLALALALSLLGFTAYAFGMISDLLRLRYGFMFFDRGLDVGASYVSALYKHFLVAMVIGLVHYLCTRSTHLLALGGFGLIVLAVGQHYGVDAEGVFRLLVPFRYVFFPILLALAFSDLVKYFVHGSSRAVRPGTQA